jgi:octaprenyl-diphosphate synthase
VPVYPLEARQKKKMRASLQPLMDLVAADLSAVNTTIVERMASRVSLIPELAGHIVASGGKRLRPMLTLASARMCGYQGDQHIKLAAIVEFIHTATLLHDDVVDQSELRRGNSTANALWGNEASVLVGDFLFSLAFKIMVETGSTKVLGILASASAMIAEGEVLQLLTTNDTSTTEDAYLDVVAAKTAALFAATCRISAVISNRGAVEEEALASYGRNLGIAYQFVDDVLDFAAQEVDMGKSVGDDFREGKITLPIILAFRRGSEDEQKFWRRTLEDGEQKGGDLERAIQLLNQQGALTDTLDRARHFGAIAQDALAIFPASPEKDALLQVVDFCINRVH